MPYLYLKRQLHTHHGRKRKKIVANGKLFFSNRSLSARNDQNAEFGVIYVVASGGIDPMM